MQEQQVCKNCGNHFTGKFCNNCGEKVYGEHSKSFSHLAEEVFHFFTHLDSKYLKTLKVIFFKPGQMSLDYCDGVRKKYFKPVSLFLIGIIIYLLLPIAQGLNLNLSTNLSNTKAIGLGFTQQLVNKKIAGKNISFEEFSEKYQQKSTVLAKPMLFIILPLLGWALMLFFNTKRKYYFDHFILGIEISNFFLYLAFIIMPALFAGITKLIFLIAGTDLRYDDYITGPIIMLALIINWSIAFSRFYKVRSITAFLKSILFLIPFTLVVYFIYRILLFLTTLIFI